jgi:hypothetical protein
MPASYPTSVKTFTTKSDGAGNTILAAHVNDIQAEVTAIETDLLTAFPGGGADGGQLKFPATQNPSADANTQDDYEEGLWTPVIGGSGGTSGQTYASQTGTYVKIGQLVFVGFDVTLTAKGTITTDVQIQGLPFASGAVAHGVPIDGIVILNTAVVSICGYMASGETAVTLLIRTAAAASATAAATADIANNTRISGSFCYRAAA